MRVEIKKLLYIFVCRINILLLMVIVGLCVSCSSKNEFEPPLVYTAKSIKKDNLYEVRLFNDIGKERDDWKLQSVVLDETNGNLLKLNGTKRIFIYDFEKRSYKTEITKPEPTGHDNDCCIIDDTLYIVGSHTSKSESKKLYRWSMERNIIELLQVEGIEEAKNKSIRCLMGVCVYSINELLLVTQDYFHDSTYGITHKDTDQLCVYKYNVETLHCEKVFEMKWDAVFIQGATYVNDLLYVACNIQTEKHAGWYKGIEFKVINLETKKEEDKILLEGTFEAEGLMSYQRDGESYLLFGISNPGRLSQIVTMKI